MSLYSDLARFDFLSYLYLCLLEIVYSFMIVILFTNSNMDCIFNWRRFKINVGRRSLYSLLLRVLHSLSDGCHMVGCPIVVHGGGLLCWMVQWYMVLLYLYPTMVHSAPLYSGLVHGAIAVLYRPARPTYLITLACSSQIYIHK